MTQVSLWLVLVVISCAFSLLSCSTETTTGQAKATFLLSTGETATAILSMTPGPIPLLSSGTTTDTSMATVTPWLTLTSTPEPTNAYSPTSVPTATPTHTLIPTAMPTPAMTSVTAALIYPDIGLVLVNSAGELVQRISAPGTPIGAAWSPDGCYLQVMVTTGQNIRLFELDLANGTEQEVFIGGEDANGNWRTDPLLSPDRKWIAYIVWSGKRKPFAGSEFQDVEVIAMNERTKPFRLTRRGGANSYIWSPDSQYLAYSDYDEAGNSQLYLSRPDGSDRCQLTHFTTSKFTIGGIDWSPDGQRLSFAVFDQDDNLQGTWVVRSDGSGLRAMTLDDDSAVRGSALLWSADSRTLVVYVWGDESVEGLYWFNPDTGRVDHIFYAVKAPWKTISFPFPISDVQTIGFLGGDHNFYSYNLADGTYKLWLDKSTLFPEYKDSKEGYPILRQVVTIPGGSVDMSRCPSK